MQNTIQRPAARSASSQVDLRASQAMGPAEPTRAAVLQSGTPIPDSLERAGTASASRLTLGATDRALPVAALFFPLQPGVKQIYTTRVSPVQDPETSYPGRYEIETASVERKAGEVVVKLKSSDSFTERMRFSTLRLTDTRAVLEGITMLGIGEEPAPGHTIDFLRLPLKAGARWDDGQWIGTVRGEERVETPLGERMGWRISVIGTYDRAYTNVGDYWVVPGMGIVRADVTIDGAHVRTSLESIEAAPPKPAAATDR